MAGRCRNYVWENLNDEALLDTRFCDLKLRLENTPLAERTERVNCELERRQIVFRPHYWLSEEWFSPGSVPGVAIPFYLAHPRLSKLEYQQNALPVDREVTLRGGILRDIAGINRA